MLPDFNLNAVRISVFYILFLKIFHDSDMDKTKNNESAGSLASIIEIRTEGPNGRLLVRTWLSGLMLLSFFGLLLLLDVRYDAWQMVRIELASSPLRLLHIIAENAYERRFLQKCLYLDFGFLTGFTMVFVASARLISLDRTISRNLLSALAILPGLLDMAENVLLLFMLQGESYMFGLFTYYRLSALTKFILVLPATVMACVVLGKLISRALRKMQHVSDIKISDKNQTDDYPPSDIFP